MSPDDVCLRSSGLRRPRNFCGGCVNSPVRFRPDSVSIGSKRMSAAEIFFDTNVLLYLISGDPVKADQAETLISGGGVISAKVLNEFASVASRKRSLTAAGDSGGVICGAGGVFARAGDRSNA